MLYRLIGVCVALLGLFFVVMHVHARDVGQWENTNPEIRRWFSSLMQPDAPNVPCCGEADAYWADDIKVEGDRVFAVITDTRDDGPLGRPHIPVGTRFEIPKNKYKYDKGNPTGHNILFVGAYGTVFCFIQGGGV